MQLTHVCVATCADLAHDPGGAACWGSQHCSPGPALPLHAGLEALGRVCESARSHRAQQGGTTGLLRSQISRLKSFISGSQDAKRDMCHPVRQWVAASMAVVMHFTVLAPPARVLVDERNCCILAGALLAESPVASAGFELTVCVRFRNGGRGFSLGVHSP